MLAVDAVDAVQGIKLGAAKTQVKEHKLEVPCRKQGRSRSDDAPYHEQRHEGKVIADSLVENDKERSEDGVQHGKLVTHLSLVLQRGVGVAWREFNLLLKLIVVIVLQRGVGVAWGDNYFLILGILFRKVF